MQKLILGYFLFKYGRSLISTLIQLAIGLAFLCAYGFYKLFQFIVFSFENSPTESALIFTLIGGFLYVAHLLQSLVSKTKNQIHLKRCESKNRSKRSLSTFSDFNS
jgi:hypothetical protein